MEVYPNAPVVGYTGAEVLNIVHAEGDGVGDFNVSVVSTEMVPEEHLLSITFLSDDDSIRAENYMMQDETAGDTLFVFGDDLEGKGIGPAGNGILPIISTLKTVEIDSPNTQMVRNSNTNIPVKIRYSTAFPINLRRIGYPENVDVIFSDVI